MKKNVELNVNDFLKKNIESSYQRNANSTYSEIVPHPSQKDYHQLIQQQKLGKIWREGEPCLVLVEVQSNTDSLDMISNTKNKLSCDPTISLQGLYPGTPYSTTVITELHSLLLLYSVQKKLEKIVVHQ